MLTLERTVGAVELPGTEERRVRLAPARVAPVEALKARNAEKLLWPVVGFRNPLESYGTGAQFRNRVP